MAAGVLSCHTFKVDRRSIREDEAAPDDLNAVLTVPNPRVVRADKAGALRNQQIPSCRGVVNVLANQSFDLPGQIRIQSLFENSRNVPASFDLVRSGRLGSGRVQIVSGGARSRPRQEGLLAVLHVLRLILLRRAIRLTGDR